MTKIIYDAQTKLKTTVEVEDESIIEEQSEPTQEERTAALEDAVLYIIMGGGI